MLETCCGYIGAYARCDGREDSMTKTKEMMSFHFIKVRKVARGANRRGWLAAALLPSGPEEAKELVRESAP